MYQQLSLYLICMDLILHENRHSPRFHERPRHGHLLGEGDDLLLLLIHCSDQRRDNETLNKCASAISLLTEGLGDSWLPLRRTLHCDYQYTCNYNWMKIGLALQLPTL